MAAITTLIGNTVSDIELRFTQAGKAVGSVTIAVSDRVKKNDEWVDGKTWFARCTIWGDMAENAAGSIMKGTRVIAQGRLEQREWEDKDGGKRTAVEVIVDEIGASLRYATAVVSRVTRGGGVQDRGAQGGSAVPESWAEVGSDDTPF